MSALHVQLIDRMDQFEKLRPAWDELFTADQHASVFMSWAWMRGWIEVSPYPWSVLGVRDHADSRWVGFLPVSLRGKQAAYRLDQVREIHMAGDPAADYTGFLCDPSCEPMVLAALASYVTEQLKWDRVRFKEVNDPRLDDFLKSLDHSAIDVVIHAGTCCPFIPLPPTWDEYIQQCIGYESRKSLRKKLRLVERECQVTHLNADNAQQQIEDLLALAAMREHHTIDDSLARYRHVFKWTVAAGLASVVIIRHDQTPIAGMGYFIDEKVRSMCFWMTGYDDRFAQYSPGRVVNAICIQHAIERQLKVLDFLRGDEPYKMQFGAQRRFTRHATVVRRGWNTATRLIMNRVRQKLRV